VKKSKRMDRYYVRTIITVIHVTDSKFGFGLDSFKIDIENRFSSGQMHYVTQSFKNICPTSYCSLQSLVL